MGGIAAKDTTEGDKGPGPVILVFVGIPESPDRERDLEGARRRYDPVRNPRLIKNLPASLFKCTDDRLIPFRTHDDDAGARQVREIGDVYKRQARANSLKLPRACCRRRLL